MSHMWIKPPRIATFVAVAVAAVASAASGAAVSPPTSGAGPSSGPSSAASSAASSAPPAPPPRKASAAERAAADRLDPLARAAFWAREADVNPSDAAAGVRLAAALRQLTRYDEADAAATKVLVLDPNNVEALLEQARARIGEQQAFYGIASLKQAMQQAPKDWRPVFLLGLAYEQTERLDEAREAYRKALVLSPNNPSILSNLALTFATHGDAVQAEQMLRLAVAQPGASAAVRQNLALVLGMTGRLAEAEKLIREDLPPDAAAANLAYLKSIQPKP